MGQKAVYISGMIPNGAKKVAMFWFQDRFISFVTDREHQQFIILLRFPKDEDDRQMDEYYKTFWGNSYKLSYQD